MTTEIESLYREHAPSLIARCHAILGDRERAADATHDTFVRFIERYADLAESPKARALLQRIATNRCRDELRSSRRRTQLAHLALGHQTSRPATQHDSATLNDVTSRLSDADRELLTMRHVDGMTLAQIARHQRTSISSAKRRLTRICLEASLLALLIALIVALFASEGHSQHTRAHDPLPAQSTEPDPHTPHVTPDTESSALDRACEQGRWRACSRAADAHYRAKRYTHALHAAQRACEHPDTTRSYRLQTCQRAGLLALWHTSDHELSQRMFERGCEGDTSHDTPLELAFRQESCARVR